MAFSLFVLNFICWESFGLAAFLVFDVARTLRRNRAARSGNNT